MNVITWSVALRQAREEAGLTQEQLAERCGVSQPAVSRWESQKHIVGEATVRLVEIALGVRFRITWEKG